jgi:hypothetical protein
MFHHQFVTASMQTGQSPSSEFSHLQMHNIVRIRILNTLPTPSAPPQSTNTLICCLVIERGVLPVTATLICTPRSRSSISLSLEESCRVFPLRPCTQFRNPLNLIILKGNFTNCLSLREHSKSSAHSCPTKNANISHVPVIIPKTFMITRLDRPRFAIVFEMGKAYGCLLHPPPYPPSPSPPTHPSHSSCLHPSYPT